MPIQYGVPFYPGFVNSPLLPQLAAGPQNIPEFGKAFDAFFAGQDVARKQGLQSLFSGSNLDAFRNPDGSINWGKATEAYLQAAGPEALPAAISGAGGEYLKSLPPVGLGGVPSAPRPSSVPTSLGRPPGSAKQSDETSVAGGEPLRPGQKGNLTDDGEVLDVTIDGQPITEPKKGAATSYASEAPPDARYPAQFSQIPDTGPAPGRFTPQAATTEMMPRERVAQAQPQPRSQIPGIPTQPQGTFNEAEMRYWQTEATNALELARRAALSQGPGAAETAKMYADYAQQAQARAQSIQQGLIELQGKQGGARVDLEKGIFEGSRKGFLAANQQQTQLDTIDKDLKTLGPDWTGAGASARAKLARTANTFLNLLPKDVREALPNEIRDGFSNEALASWESYNKASQKLGFALASSLGSREAMQIVQAATASVPNADQTYWGARLVSAGMRQAAERDKDFHKYVIERMRSGQSTLDADVTFNQLHPISEYVNKASSVVPPQKAIDYLRAYPTPQNKKYFDQTYGDGATVGVFGPVR